MSKCGFILMNTYEKCTCCCSVVDKVDTSYSAFLCLKLDFFVIYLVQIKYLNGLLFYCSIICTAIVPHSHRDIKLDIVYDPLNTIVEAEV